MAIQNDTELEWAKQKVKAEQQSIDIQKQEMQSNGFTAEQIKSASDPLVSFSLKLKEDIEEFEQLKNNKTKK